jgi:hypothetical protein
MMRKEAEKLAKEIDATPGVTVTGYRNDGSDVAIEVQDTKTGIPFVVDSRESWEERRKAATFYDDK